MPIDTLPSQTGDSTGTRRGLPAISPIVTPISTLTEEVGVIRTRVRGLGGDTQQLHERYFERDLEQRQMNLSKSAVADLLVRLSDCGFAWRDVARMVGVSVPALQKWRRSEKTTGENRLKVAKVVAFVQMLEEMMIDDPASWLEMPIMDGVSLNRIDLIASSRASLVFELAGDHTTPENVLARFDEHWRDNLTDPDFETYVDSDGVRAIRPKR